MRLGSGHPVRANMASADKRGGAAARKILLVAALGLAVVAAAVHWLFYDSGPAPSGA